MRLDYEGRKTLKGNSEKVMNRYLAHLFSALKIFLCYHRKITHCFLCICLFVLAPAYASANTRAIAINATFADAPAVSAEDNLSISSLVSMADRLVQEAISSNANASTFRIDATLYRESLRSLMINAEKTTTNSPQSKAMFMELVRMSALIQSAAACKTGRYIVCPIELRQQLLAQQQRLHKLAASQS